MNHHLDLSRAIWRKSARSNQDGNCVEVATNLPGVVAVRDSKNPDGPKLILSRESWERFSRGVRRGGYEG